MYISILPQFVSSNIKIKFEFLILLYHLLQESNYRVYIYKVHCYKV